MIGGAMGSQPKHAINLALQGGGAHGAYTWGVLDRLLEEDAIHIEAISGASAGAMNAVCLADGYQRNGRQGARDRLRHFWMAVGNSTQFSPLRRTPIEAWLGTWSMDTSPALLALDLMSQIYSPYDFNPLDINPLQDIVAEQINFNNVQQCKAIRLFVSATNVWNGKVRVFENEEITLKTVMASSCLPSMYKAVKIDGVPYWDGGYMGNPVLFPFFDVTGSEDILLVQINPIERIATPKTARQIANRVNEITFNASLLSELRAIGFVSRLLREGKISREEYRDIRMHRVDAPDELKKLSASTKLNAEPDFLNHLMELGRGAAQAWIDSGMEKVGKEAGIDLLDEISYGVSQPLPAYVPPRAAMELERGKRRKSRAKPAK